MVIHWCLDTDWCIDPISLYYQLMNSHESTVPIYVLILYYHRSFMSRVRNILQKNTILYGD